MTASIDDAQQQVLALLAQRGSDKTICPSEIARALAPDHWRTAMQTVHAAVDRLHADRVVTLSWKGAPLAERAGPYRIALTPPAVDPIR